MDSLLEFIDRVSFLAAMPAVVGLFVALGMLLLTQRWQVHVLGMAILYLFVGLLHIQVIRPEVALVKEIVFNILGPEFRINIRDKYGGS